MTRDTMYFSTIRHKTTWIYNTSYTHAYYIIFRFQNIIIKKNSNKFVSPKIGMLYFPPESIQRCLSRGYFSYESQKKKSTEAFNLLLVYPSSSYFKTKYMYSIKKKSNNKKIKIFVNNIYFNKRCILLIL
jgi:hypothetical protein